MAGLTATVIWGRTGTSDTTSRSAKVRHESLCLGGPHHSRILQARSAHQVGRNRSGRRPLHRRRPPKTSHAIAVQIIHLRQRESERERERASEGGPISQSHAEGARHVSHPRGRVTQRQPLKLEKARMGRLAASVEVTLAIADEYPILHPEQQERSASWIFCAEEQCKFCCGENKNKATKGARAASAPGQHTQAHPHPDHNGETELGAGYAGTFALSTPSPPERAQLTGGAVELHVTTRRRTELGTGYAGALAPKAPPRRQLAGARPVGLLPAGGKT